MLTPLIITNNSPNTWGRVPLPNEAIAILFGLALASAISPGSVSAGSDGLTDIAKLVVQTLATGTTSRTKSKVRPV
jgi:hypothetical protein